VQIPLLREVQHVLSQTYLSRSTVKSFFAGQIKHLPLVGVSPCTFWRNAHLLDIQKQGHSQADILKLFREAVTAECGHQLGQVGTGDGAYVYLDDVLFSGSRIGNDLSAWIAESAPKRSIVHVLVMATHRFGEWKCRTRLEDEAKKAGKHIELHFWAAIRVENRRARRDVSEVLWPATLPDDVLVTDYLKSESRFPFEPRTPGAMPQDSPFSSAEHRALLEQEMLLAGLRIRSFCKAPKSVVRPLGFSPFGLGFGSMIVTYRNCPNNTPLALWWGDPSAQPASPLSRWYPLLPRKTYSQGSPFDVIEF